MAEEIEFGKWLRQRRKELSITQEELAERLNVSWITLRKLESGERHPSGQIALLLAEHLRVPLDEREAFVAFARTERQLAGAANPTAPWRSAFIQKTNLPSRLTPLIGRKKEVGEAVDYLQSSRTRLLTLTGAPGIGKTRLALQIGFALLANFEDGVFFVDLSPVTDPEMVLTAMARTFDIKKSSQQPLESVLLEYLKQKRLLLVLDNFEQVLDASIDVVTLMEASPWLKVLVTSRQALNVRGERRFLVPPLSLPDKRQSLTLEQMASCPSVALYMERAEVVDAEFALTESNMDDVAALCIELEGLPLAIELAASQVRHLSPREMRHALASRLKVLTGGARDLPPRHRTLRGAIEWSYGLLSSDEQKLLRRLSVFVGGFTPRAAMAVWGDVEDVEDAEPDNKGEQVFFPDVLWSLEEKNLIKREGQVGDAEVRLGLLEAIREFALEKLRQSGEQEVWETENKRSNYFMALAEESEHYVRGSTQAEWLNRLEDEHSNFLATLKWAVEHSTKRKHGSDNDDDNDNDNDNRKRVEAAEILLKTATGLRYFWYIHGYLSEGHEWLEEALACSDLLAMDTSSSSSLSAEELQAMRANALAGAANLLNELGDYAAGNAFRLESLAIRRQLNDMRGVASSLNDLGVSAIDQGNQAASREFFAEGLAIWRELGDRQGEALALTNLGRAIYMQGEYDQALALHEASLELWRTLGNKRGTALCLTNLGLVLYDKGDFEAAKSLFHEALQIQREIGNKWGVALLLTEIGNVALMQKDRTATRSYYDESLKVSREMGDTKGISYTLHCIALLAFSQGEFERARVLLQESLTIKRSLGNKVYIAFGLGPLGCTLIALRAGDEVTARATMLIGTADAFLSSLGIVWPPEDQMVNEIGVAEARDLLGEEGFGKAFAEGREMNIDDAIAYALDPEGSPAPAI